MPHKDPEAAQTYNREYKRANRWRYRTRQKAYDAATHANERAIRFGVEGTITPEDVEAVLAIGRCHHCGSPGPLEIDHLVPMDKGGMNLPSNLVASCGACNRSKQQTPAPWRWSRAHDACVECGRTDRPHVTAGRCRSCQSRVASRERRARERAQREGLPATGH